MGLSHFPTASDGVLPLLVMNTVVSVSLLKNMVRSVLNVAESEDEDSREVEGENPDEDSTGRRRISITQFKSLCENRGEGERGGCSGDVINGGIGEGTGVAECCVCLCGYKEEEEISELDSCRHFFHRACLDRWLGSRHTTCPLCRSIL
ncbi:PREDICTED: probable E3 ubiquitin-protein ligase XERICO [Tarenaya hassleriana]|uniref:probable E3 ubiquitin-protein ligase XERICO n=1 Tax=Tarenaya hassleriana TaxID=28532 RepID=UPI00053C558A|nr:PREDICTED: probable E3 ubiquitin-protein ligase XERICO [Tarenaya hassleriana]